MHTVAVIAGGFALLAIFLLVAKFGLGTPHAIARAALIFLPVWLALAAVNMWVGVSKAGYSVRQELPILLVVFIVPAAAALIVFWRTGVR
jgi:uncharacterized membrane protein YwaF